MFGLFGKKYKKQADIIGASLHKQIFDAMNVNEKLASIKIESPFAAGYLNNFMRAGLEAQGASIDEAEDYFEYICDGVYPKKLNSIVLNQSLLSMNDKSKQKDYNLGGEVAVSDIHYEVIGKKFTEALGDDILDNPSTNLKSYLLGKKMTYYNLDTKEEKTLKM